MISVLDYLDYDVCLLLGRYIDYRKRFNKVIKELDKLINFNVHIKYFQSFNVQGLNGCRIKLIKKIMNTRRKSRWLHNWPTKPPHFNYNPRNIVKKLKDNYIIQFNNGNSWKLKQYPPDKQLYVLDRLELIDLK